MFSFLRRAATAAVIGSGAAYASDAWNRKQTVSLAGYVDYMKKGLMFASENEAGLRTSAAKVVSGAKKALSTAERALRERPDDSHSSERRPR